ncbi:hypothetical protein PENTCL1PPCAC_25731, partial [Pristionchus entomophagus]
IPLLSSMSQFPTVSSPPSSSDSPPDMPYIEPPPVYSSLSDDKICFRAEEKKRSQLMSPFTARRTPKKFAVFHIIASSIVCAIAAIYVFTLNNPRPHKRDDYDFIRNFFLLCCIPAVPSFASAFFAIKKNRPNFLLPIIVYMLIAFSLLFLLLGLGLACAFINNFSEGFAIILGWMFFGCLIVPLLYTSHAARLYLRVRVDMIEENRARREEMKQPIMI